MENVQNATVAVTKQSGHLAPGIGFGALLRFFGLAPKSTMDLEDQDDRTLSGLGVRRGQLADLGDRIYEARWATFDPMLGRAHS